MSESDSINLHGRQHYSTLEERLNIGSHALGFVLSIVALVLMVIKAAQVGNAWEIVSVSIFGATLVILYLVSTLYHSTRDHLLRSRMRVADHATIYLLIAGTYTPFTLLVLKGVVGWVIFGVSWGMAAAGVALKLFYTGRYEKLSTLMYVFMGWLIMFAIEPLAQNLSHEGLAWLVAGGVSYTVGAVLYAIRQIPLNHAIFHVFVLGGSVCHFVSVYFYVLGA